jgi:hypothetical protein
MHEEVQQPSDLALAEASFLQRVMIAAQAGLSGLVMLISIINERHAVVREGGRTVVITETYDPVLRRRWIVRGSFTDFKNFYMAVQVQVGTRKDGEPEFKRVGDLWLESGGRRQYEGITFSPAGDQPGFFNLWRGFSVKEQRGDWSFMSRHIRDVLCRGNERLFDYVMTWMAHRVQRPGEQAEVALVLRGPRGTGKSLYGRLFGSLFGQHFVHVSHPRHLTGNFNAHLQDGVLIFADEAFGAASHAGEGVLKMLITEDAIPIERKGRDVVFVKNCAGVIVASNNEWVIPAGLDERRFCVLDVSDAHAQDHAYFRALIDQMGAGGREAMLFDLMHWDLEEVNLRDVPRTEALDEQKMFSMRPAEKWWFEKLREGALLPSHHQWRQEVLRDELHEDYAAALGKARNQATATELGVHLRKLVPGLDETRRAVPGTSIRKWYWVLPELQVCRAHFDRLTRIANAWPSEDGPSV